MKKLFSLTFLFTSLFTFTSIAQSNYQGQTGRAMPQFIGELATNVGTGFGQHRALKFDEVDSDIYKTKGTNFLNDEWGKGKLYFTLNRVLENDFIKYDIENNYFIINSDGIKNPSPDQIRVFHNHNIIAFELTDPVIGQRFFFNAANNNVTENGEVLNGFLEVIVDHENLSLYRKIETEHLQASYNVALNAGDKADKIIKKEIYYIKHPETLEIKRLTKSRKRNKLLFEKHQDKMHSFMKDNKTKFDSEEDLIKLVSYYNSLH